MEHIIIYISIGFFTGFLSGMFGVGGGSIRIPLLNFAGVSLVNAFGINLFIIPFSSLIGSVTHSGNIDRKIALYVIAGGILGSIIAAFFVGLMPAVFLAVLFVVTAVLTVSGMYFDRISPAVSRRINPGPRTFFLFPFFLSLIAGMRGGSGGSLFSPFLKAMKMNMHRAIATSLFVTIFTSTGAVIIYWNRGDIVWFPALCVLSGSAVGVIVGSKISIKTEPVWLKIEFTIIEMLLAFGVLYKALHI